MNIKPALIATVTIILGASSQLVVWAQQGKPIIKAPNKMPIESLYLPDFRIYKVTIDGKKATVEISNQCKANAPHSYLNLTLYKGGTKDSGLAGLWGFDVPAIPAGGKTTVTIDLSKLDGAASQTFEGRYYRVEVDPQNKIKEAVEGNNWFERNSAPFPDAANSCEPVSPPSANALADLRITKVTISGGQMYVEITNQCKGAAVASRLHLALFGGPTKGSPGGLELEADTPPIGPGAKVSVVFDLKSYGSKFASFGDKYYRLDADYYNKVKETIEGNNWWEKSAGPFPDAANSCNQK